MVLVAESYDIAPETGVEESYITYSSLTEEELIEVSSSGAEKVTCGLARTLTLTAPSFGFAAVIFGPESEPDPPLLQPVRVIRNANKKITAALDRDFTVRFIPRKISLFVGNYGREEVLSIFPQHKAAMPRLLAKTVKNGSVGGN